MSEGAKDGAIIGGILAFAMLFAGALFGFVHCNRAAQQQLINTHVNPAFESPEYEISPQTARETQLAAAAYDSDASNEETQPIDEKAEVSTASAPAESEFLSKPAQTWSADDVMAWARSKKLQFDFDGLKEADISGEDLLELNAETLEEDLRVTKKLQQAKILRAIKKLTDGPDLRLSAAEIVEM
jgi:hypothetical protein